MVGLEINKTLEYVNYGYNQISQEMKQAGKTLSFLLVRKNQLEGRRFSKGSNTFRLGILGDPGAQ